MSKFYNSAVVIIPPQEKWESIQEIRETYDRGFNRWMPHITLIYPFFYVESILMLVGGILGLALKD